ncbi:MAG: hypothetical protein NVS2B14_15620 [Chamaesiphon sp.]
MTETPSPQPAEKIENIEELLLLLRRKEGTWVDWGQACAKLQKAGYSTQAIFEQTGFEPVQQNQIIVASQVYNTMVNAGVSAQVRSHYQRTGSDSLYELRILTQPERAAAAELLVAKNLDSESAREVAKALKEFARMQILPEGFSDSAGDALAYQYWRYAKQQTDLQERARLIGRGLMFAHSQTARQQIELLLTEFSSVPNRPAPRLPLYRLEAEEELPRMIPVAGQLPLTPNELQDVPKVEETGLFQLVQTSGKGAWVSLPGWKVILKAQDPVIVLCNTSDLPTQLTSKLEEILLVIDRSESEWDANSYFVVEQSGQVQIQWFPDTANIPLLGRLILVLRAKKILDETTSKDLWQIDE